MWVQHFQRTVLKALKKAKKFQGNNRFSLFLIFVGLLIFIFGGVNYYRVRILSFNKVPVEVQKSTENIDIPIEIIIPSLQIDLKVDPGQIKDGVWQISETNATFLNTSAAPEANGNTVIYGHNKQVIFGNLPYLSIGQKILVKTKGGKIYNYLATQKYFVGPDRTDLVSPTKDNELTVYTCYGLFDSQRVVIKATPTL